MRFLIPFLFVATPALADAPIGAEAFEKLVTGKTLTFSNLSGPYGIEYYAPNRQVIWSFIGGECKNGEWYEEANDLGPSICFVYDDDPDPQCWYVYEENGEIRADFVDSAGTSVLYQLTESQPLICNGAGT